jgi:hypothetical protein
MKWNIFGKSLDEIMNEIPLAAEVKVTTTQISDVLCTRDKFFHSCWLRLKMLRPDLIPEMGQVELYTAGMDGYVAESEEETEEDETEHGTII